MTSIDRISTGRLERTSRGWRAETHILATDVQGDVWSKRANAMAAPGVPQYGAPHPRIPGIQVTEIYVDPEPGTTTSFVVRVVYEAPDPRAQTIPPGAPYGPPSVEVATDVVQEDTREDIHGDPITVTFSGYYTSRTWLAGQLLDQQSFTPRAWSLRTVEVSRPTLVVRLRRLERALPLQLQRDMIGTVNRTEWEGFAAATLLCRAVTATPRGEYYEVVYELQHKDSGWQARVEIQLGGGANPPPEAVVGNGIEIYDIYPTYELRQAGLYIP
jgi:hypothetical protein